MDTINIAEYWYPLVISVYCITPAQIFTCVSMETCCLQPKSKSTALLMEVQGWYLCSWFLQHFKTCSQARKESGGFKSLFLLCFFTAETWPQKESWLWAISAAMSRRWPTEQGQGCFVGTLHALGQAPTQRAGGPTWEMRQLATSLRSTSVSVRKKSADAWLCRYTCPACVCWCPTRQLQDKANLFSLKKGVEWQFTTAKRLFSHARGRFATQNTVISRSLKSQRERHKATERGHSISNLFKSCCKEVKLTWGGCYIRGECVHSFLMQVRALSLQKREQMGHWWRAQALWMALCILLQFCHAGNSPASVISMNKR